MRIVGHDSYLMRGLPEPPPDCPCGSPYVREYVAPDGTVELTCPECDAEPCRVCRTLLVWDDEADDFACPVCDAPLEAA